MQAWLLSGPSGRSGTAWLQGTHGRPEGSGAIRRGDVGRRLGGAEEEGGVGVMEEGHLAPQGWAVKDTPCIVPRRPVSVRGGSPEKRPN